MQKEDCREIITYAENALSEISCKDENGAWIEIERIKVKMDVIEAPEQIREAYQKMCNGLKKYGVWDVKYRSVEDFKFFMLRYLRNVN